MSLSTWEPVAGEQEASSGHGVEARSAVTSSWVQGRTAVRDTRGSQGRDRGITGEVRAGPGQGRRPATPGTVGLIEHELKA